jgi:sugar lactone lactonase YvrE
MRDFSLSLSDLDYSGSGLDRPECVLTTASGDLYVSDRRGGVTRVTADGACQLYAGKTMDGQPLGANGFAMLADGSFLVAPLAGGGVFRLYRDGRAEMYLEHVDGRALCCANFVMLDHQGRIWICCITCEHRSTVSSYHRDKRDGFIVMIDDRGARIVADMVGFPNEIRVDPTGRYLYTNETVAGRLLRFPIQVDGSLGPLEVIAEFDETNMLDGFTLDSEGGAWMTALMSNRLWYVPSHGGQPRLLIEDSDADQLVRVVELQRTTGISKALLYEEHGSTLRNVSSVAFGGPDLKTVYLGNLMGDRIASFRAPVAGIKPPHWHFGPFS